jgi:probable HAF family extracellular repeat protein
MPSRGAFGSIAGALALLGTPLASAAFPIFTPLGDLSGGAFNSQASGISADGRIVVGFSVTEVGAEAFRWSAETGMVGLGNLPAGTESRAEATSADGSAVVGRSYDLEGYEEAFLWTTQTGMIGLGNIPGGNSSSALDVSAEGSVVVGVANIPLLGAEAFGWTSGAGAQDLGFYSAEAISADGSVVVGIDNPSTLRPVLWSNTTGLLDLGDLPGGGSNGVANGISADGLVVVGDSASASGTEAFRWTAQTGMVSLGDLPGGTFASRGLDASADGSVVVGASADGGASLAPFVWTSEDGMQSLQELLQTLGMDLSGWDLYGATAVSDDGRTIVGTALNPAGDLEAWLAEIPLPDEFEQLLVGSDQSGIVLGGTDAPGGLAFSLAEVLSAGALVAEYEPLTSQQVNDRVLGGEFSALDFAVPGDTVQLWTIEFTGSFQGLSTLTFSYDQDLLLPGWGDDNGGESRLAVYHFEDGRWHLLPGLVDPIANTITVQTASLSPFALGVVPEPSLPLLLGVGACALLVSGRIGGGARRTSRGCGRGGEVAIPLPWIGAPARRSRSRCA